MFVLWILRPGLVDYWQRDRVSLKRAWLEEYAAYKSREYAAHGGQRAGWRFMVTPEVRRAALDSPEGRMREYQRRMDEALAARGGVVSETEARRLRRVIFNDVQVEAGQIQG